LVALSLRLYLVTILEGVLVRLVRLVLLHCALLLCLVQLVTSSLVAPALLAAP
jgi:hypothetical protein